MRIGFTSIYSWRPHVEHLHYLAGLAREIGHEVSFLGCDADLAYCYTKALRPERSDFMHCARCRVGGVRSYVSDGVCPIGELDDGEVVVPDSASEWSYSSASTLGRFESDEDFASADFQALAERLEAPTRRTYTAAVRWIERNRLNAVCLFNGRMDMTRAVLEAANTAGVPFVSMERTWFGDGLQLLPGENCLGLRNIGRLMREWRDRPLSRVQALRAASHVASRFLRVNSKEWRAYNIAAQTAVWPQTNAHLRVLLVPGSRNEVWGHPDWFSQWNERTAAFDALIERLGLTTADLILRCHPNWGEHIGSQDGCKAERYYTEWAKRRGVHCIASNDPTSTLDLIEHSDAIVVCGGSAALEAGVLGKQVIAVAPSVYQHAGFQSDADTAEAMSQLTLYASLDAAERARNAADTARRTLRFAYTMVYRVPQYVDHVRCISTTHFDYREGADPVRFEKLLRDGVLQPDDTKFASDSCGEDEVLAMIAARDWQALVDAAPASSFTRPRPVKRRWMFRPVDHIRATMKRGDL